LNFNSWHFVAFFVVVYTVYRLLAFRPFWQKVALLAASYYFYGQWSYTYLGLIGFSTVLDYSVARAMGAPNGAALRAWLTRRKLLLLSLLCNLGILATFKYGNFLIENFNAVSGSLSSALMISPLDALLPVGISFYTFQSLSYTLDVYRGDSKPRQSLLDYALYLSFFPQLVAGPIVRDNEFFSQLDGDRQVDRAMHQAGWVLIAFGYVKKVVFADNFAPIVDAVFKAPAGKGFSETLLALYAFALQIYCDFSGYTDIAIGVALLFGFRFPKNFNYPYAALDLQAFWRRWHMTLSRWLRDYLYISLGGNRLGVGRTYINLMLTMLLGGLWHGASWNFVIWGGLHGGYLALERAFLSRFWLWRSDATAARIGRWLLTFHFVCFTWIFFRSATFSDAITVINILLRPAFDFDYQLHLPTLMALVLCFSMHFIGARIDTKAWLARQARPIFYSVLVAACLLLIWFTPSTASPFIYFQF